MISLARIQHQMMVVIIFFSVMALAAIGVSAHETRIIGEEEYLVIVGLVVEPPYTDERNGLDLIIRTADDGEPVTHLEETLFAEIVAPDGESTRELPVRAVYGKPGYYTADVILTQPGQYQFRIWGYVRSVKFNELFDTSDVAEISGIRFPD